MTSLQTSQTVDSVEYWYEDDWEYEQETFENDFPVKHKTGKRHKKKLSAVGTKQKQAIKAEVKKSSNDVLQSLTEEFSKHPGFSDVGSHQLKKEINRIQIIEDQNVKSKNNIEKKLSKTKTKRLSNCEVDVSPKWSAPEPTTLWQEMKFTSINLYEEEHYFETLGCNIELRPTPEYILNKLKKERFRDWYQQKKKHEDECYHEEPNYYDPDFYYYKYKHHYSKCFICSYEFGPYVRRWIKLPCGHLFHVECIHKWLGEYSDLCPIDFKYIGQ